MALLVNLPTSAVGFPFSASYARITIWQGDKGNTVLMVDFYASQAARDDAAQPVDRRSYTAPTLELTGMASMYDWLKMLPDFADAIDV